MQTGDSTDLAPSSGASPAQSDREEKKPASAEEPEQGDLFARAQWKLLQVRQLREHKRMLVDLGV